MQKIKADYFSGGSAMHKILLDTGCDFLESRPNVS